MDFESLLKEVTMLKEENAKQNKCIEVKSTWTAEKKKDCIFLKQNAAKELGYNYEIWVYNSKGVRVEKYE